MKRWAMLMLLGLVGCGSGIEGEDASSSLANRFDGEWRLTTEGDERTVCIEAGRVTGGDTCEDGSSNCWRLRDATTVAVSGDQFILSWSQFFGPVVTSGFYSTLYHSFVGSIQADDTISGIYTERLQNNTSTPDIEIEIAGIMARVSRDCGSSEM